MTSILCAQLALCLPALPLTDCSSPPPSHLRWSMPSHPSQRPWQTWVLSSPAGRTDSAKVGGELGEEGRCKKLGGEESWETEDAGLGERERERTLGAYLFQCAGSNKGLSDLHYCICVQASEGLRELRLGGLVQSQAATY